MGLKRNIAIPLGYYFVSNILRSDSSRIINNVSWKKYAYLVQKTLSPSFIGKSDDFLQKFSLYTSKSNLFTFRLSDFCLNVRKLPYINRTIGTSSFDLDSSISTYNSKFFHLDYRSRSQFFWIANSNNYLSPEFLLQSFEKPVFKDASVFDWRNRWLSKFYSRFLKYTHNSWSRIFSKVIFKDTYNFSNKVFKDVNLLSQNAGISCFSKHILIKVLAVAVLLTVHFCLSQIIRIVLSNALRHSFKDSWYAPFL